MRRLGPQFLRNQAQGIIEGRPVGQKLVGQIRHLMMIDIPALAAMTQTIADLHPMFTLLSRAHATPPNNNLYADKIHFAEKAKKLMGIFVEGIIQKHSGNC
jgi:hypothetical protein